MLFPLNDIYTFPIEEDLVIFRREINRLFVLNSSAKFVWEGFAKGFSLEEIGAKMANLFHIPLEKALRDINALFSEWQQSLLGDALPPDGSGSEMDEKSTRALRQHLNTATPYTVRTYHLFGQSIRIRFGLPELEKLVHPLLVYLEVPSEMDSETMIDFYYDGKDYVVLLNDMQVIRERSAELARSSLFPELLSLVYPGREWIAIFHAAAIGTDQGCIVFPEASGKGKTTLVAGLMHSGLRYLSDEMTALEAAGMNIAGLPFCLNLKEKSWPLLASYYPEINELPIYRRADQNVRYLPPRSFRNINVSSLLPARCLVFPNYQSEMPMRFSPISSTESLRRLLTAETWISPDPIHIGQFIEWTRTTPSFELSYSSIESAIPLLREVLIH